VTNPPDDLVSFRNPAYERLDLVDQRLKVELVRI
jgi:hypothetical protein